MKLTQFLSSMRLICNVCILAATCILLATCSNSEPELGDITGRVTNDENQPIQGADVEIQGGGGATKTNAQGYYEFLDKGPGIYRVQVSAPGYNTEEKSVTVEIGKAKTLDFTIFPAKAKMELSTNTVNFGAEASTKQVTIKNSGSADLTWYLAEQIIWLTCTPTQGTIKPNKEASVTLMADRSRLSGGDEKDILVISSNGGNEEVTISITDASSPISVEPTSFYFDATESVQELKLSGGNDINYILTANKSWIQLSTEEGMFSGTKYIRVSVNRNGLSSGEYNGNIQVNVGTFKTNIPVKMIINDPEKPTVNLVNIIDITDQSATFCGALTSIGSSHVKKWGFCWGTVENPEISTCSNSNFGDCDGPEEKSQTVKNLSPNTTYYVRVYAENNEGISYSEQRQFNTDELPQTPIIRTGSSVETKAKSARIEGEILKLGAKGGITEHGHVWSQYASPTLADAQHTSLGSAESTGTFESSLTGLSPATTYHVRAYATNAVGTAYGEEYSFTTTPDIMTLTTSAANDITHESATLGGMITYEGGNKIIERGVCIGLSTNPNINGTHFVSSEQANSFHVKATGLQTTTSYHARAYAKAETGTVYYGNDITFQTTVEILIPSLSVPMVEGITFRSAIFNSTIAPSHGGTIKDAGFVIAIHSEPTLSDIKITSNILSDNISAKASNLQPTTRYYVRAYATNERGTGYSQVIEFTTTAKPDGSTIDAEDYEDESNWDN